MIEMLGVLAIVGVLSVAGIMGFNRAMEKYKTSKFINQVSSIQENLQEISGRHGSNQWVESTAIAIALNIFPEEMLKDYQTTGKIIHAFGGEVLISQASDGIDVSFTGVPKFAVLDAGIASWEIQNLDITGE